MNKMWNLDTNGTPYACTDTCEMPVVRFCHFALHWYAYDFHTSAMPVCGGYSNRRVKVYRLHLDAMFEKRPSPTPWHTDARMAPFDTSNMLTDSG